ncbi:MAG: ABC transporter substrate-binding protein, partial [Cyanobacteria bacterium SW_4_48_29]
MSQNNETPILIASLLITVALLVVGFSWLSDRFGGPVTGPKEQISLGEKILIEKTTSDQKAGVQAFANDNFVAAANQFQLSLEAKRNDPETRIYLNNAQLLAEPQAEFYKIAV